MRVVRQLITWVASTDRASSETINNFHEIYPQSFILTKPDEYVRLSLVYFSCVNEFTYVNDFNSSFVLSNGFPDPVNNPGTTYYLNTGFYSINDNLNSFCSFVNQFAGTFLVNDVVSVLTYPITPPNTSYIVPTLQWTAPSAGFDPYISFPNTNNQGSYKYNASDILGFPQAVPTQLKGIFPAATNYRSGASLGLPSGTFVSNTIRPPIDANYPYLQIAIDVPPQNVLYNPDQNLLTYAPIFAYIPIGDAHIVPPYGTITFVPQDIESFSWDVPSKGAFLGTINFKIQDPNGSTLPMNFDYDMGIRIQVCRRDEEEKLNDLMEQSLTIQKMLLMTIDDMRKATAPPAPEEETPATPAPEPEQNGDGPQGGRFTEAELHAGPEDVGNFLQYY